MNVGAQTNDFDTIIKNGTILDGSGLERYHADVAIKDGYIAKIGIYLNTQQTKKLMLRGNLSHLDLLMCIAMQRLPH